MRINNLITLTKLKQRKSRIENTRDRGGGAHGDQGYVRQPLPSNSPSIELPWSLRRNWRILRRRRRSLLLRDWFVNGCNLQLNREEERRYTQKKQWRRRTTLSCEKRHVGLEKAGRRKEDDRPVTAQ